MSKKYDCASEVDRVVPPSISTQDKDLVLSTDGRNNIKFMRYRRESVSIWDIVAQVNALTQKGLDLELAYQAAINKAVADMSEERDVLLDQIAKDLRQAVATLNQERQSLESSTGDALAEAKREAADAVTVAKQEAVAGVADAKREAADAVADARKEASSALAGVRADLTAATTTNANKALRNENDIASLSRDAGDMAQELSAMDSTISEKHAQAMANVNRLDTKQAALEQTLNDLSALVGPSTAIVPSVPVSCQRAALAPRQRELISLACARACLRGSRMSSSRDS